jgi:hypothetical protein
MNHYPEKRKKNKKEKERKREKEKEKKERKNEPNDLAIMITQNKREKTKKCPKENQEMPIQVRLKRKIQAHIPGAKTTSSHIRC